jgi:SAM-dependent methyltransferase
VKIKRRLYYYLSPGLRLLIRRLYYLPADIFEYLSSSNKKQPPKGLIYTGSGDFEKTGQHFKEIFISHCGLLPHHQVLDVGSGIGRIAIPLTGYLSGNAAYEGFDIVKTGVDWCKKNITASFPNFKFTHIDLENDLYNLTTSNRAKDFVFPYENNRFDLVILTSVFTHMMPEDVENYIEQISRVLKRGGRCIMTFFLLTDDIVHGMDSNNGLVFNYKYGHYSLLDKNVKEANVAFDEKYILDIFSQNKLRPEQIKYGFWSGKPKAECWDFQDIIIVEK